MLAQAVPPDPYLGTLYPRQRAATRPKVFCEKAFLVQTIRVSRCARNHH